MVKQKSTLNNKQKPNKRKTASKPRRKKGKQGKEFGDVLVQALGFRHLKELLLLFAAAVVMLFMGFLLGIYFQPPTEQPAKAVKKAEKTEKSDYYVAPVLQITPKTPPKSAAAPQDIPIVRPPKPPTPPAQDTQVASLPPEGNLPSSSPAVQAKDPLWRRNAVAFSNPQNKPMVVVIIDDMGVDKKRSRQTLDLPAPLTLSYLPYASHVPEQSILAHSKGHELMVHIPMEPENPDLDLGPHPLLTTLPQEELLNNLRWSLNQFNGYVAVNNHMGSKFTSTSSAMALVMRELKGRQLAFIDSRTSPTSKGLSSARRAGLPSLSRDIFIDHVDDDADIHTQLEKIEAKARQQGYAIAIGHPRDRTISALQVWLPTLEEKGLVLAPISAVLKEPKFRQ